MMLLEVPAALKMADIAVILGQTFAYGESQQSRIDGQVLIVDFIPGIFIFLLPITTFVFL